MLVEKDPKYNGIVLSIDFSGVGFAVFICFLAMKISGIIDWPWFYVTMPLWVPLAMVVATWLVLGIVYLIILLGAAIGAAISEKKNHDSYLSIKRRNKKDEKID